MVLYIIAQHKLEHNYKNPKKLCCASHIPSTSALFMFLFSPPSRMTILPPTEKLKVVLQKIRDFHLRFTNEFS